MTHAPELADASAEDDPQDDPQDEPTAADVGEVLEHIRQGLTFGRQAEWLLRWALPADPDNVDALTVLGHLQLQLGDYREARPTFERALALAPDNAAALVGMAEVALDADDLETAESLARRGIAAGGSGWASLAEVCAQTGRAQEAIDAFLRAYEDDPGQIHLLERHCELAEVPYAVPRPPGEVLAAKWAAIEPLTRAELYVHVARELAAPTGDFHVTGAWAQARGIDRGPLYVTLSQLGIGCDTEVVRSAGSDAAAMVVRVEGAIVGVAAWPETVLDLVDSDEPLAPPEDVEPAPMDQPPPLLAARTASDDDGAPVIRIVQQTVHGIDLRRWLEALRAVLPEGARAWLVARFVHGVEPLSTAEVWSDGILTARLLERFAGSRLDKAAHTAIDVTSKRLGRYKFVDTGPRMVPREAEQHWVCDGLAALCRADGFDWRMLVRAPLTGVGDAARGDMDLMTLVKGVTRVLMNHVGLHELGLKLELHANSGHHSGQALGWFVGIEDGQALFGLDPAKHSDLDALLGTMGHEVCHAFRAHHGLMVDDHKEEELLTDLTTVFVGFGLFSANEAYRYRTYGSVTGGYVATFGWTHDFRGYLPSQALCYALAIQHQVRNGSRRDHKLVRRLLRPLQLAHFDACDDLLEAEGLDGPALREAFGIPAPDDWGDVGAMAIAEVEWAEPEDEVTVVGGRLSEVDEQDDSWTTPIITERLDWRGLALLLLGAIAVGWLISLWDAGVGLGVGVLCLAFWGAIPTRKIAACYRCYATLDDPEALAKCRACGRDIVLPETDPDWD